MLYLSQEPILRAYGDRLLQTVLYARKRLPPARAVPAIVDY